MNLSLRLPKLYGIYGEPTCVVATRNLDDGNHFLISYKEYESALCDNPIAVEPLYQCDRVILAEGTFAIDDDLVIVGQYVHVSIHKKELYHRLWLTPLKDVLRDLCIDNGAIWGSITPDTYEYYEGVKILFNVLVR